MQDFMDSKLTSEQDQKFIRKEACDHSAGGLDKKRRREIHEEHMVEVAAKCRKDSEKAEKQLKHAAFFNGLELEIEMEKVVLMTVAQMKNQLDKLRGQDSEIPKESAMKKRDNKLQELTTALERYEAHRVARRLDPLEFKTG